MDVIAILPPVQASLNITAATLMTTGYYFIRNGNRSAHKACMISALAVSTLFFIFYLYYHSVVGNIPFAGEGMIRPIYFTVLTTHVILAAAIVPLVITTVVFVLRGKFDRHRKIARWTLPIWLYVSVTGVVIYLLAFHIYPRAC
jgi:putative membrane protein